MLSDIEDRIIGTDVRFDRVKSTDYRVSYAREYWTLKYR